LYILDLRRGRYSPSEFVWHFFDILKRYPSLIDFKVEKVILWAALKATLQAEMTKRHRFACIVELKRDNRTTKQQRIRPLQAWFKSQRIRFAEEISSKEDLILEIMQFPSQSAGCTDDILDTCADALQNEEGVNPDVIPDGEADPRQQFGMDNMRLLDKFQGFGPDGQPEWLYQQEKHKDGPPMRTGVL
jgi:hypothetical protein